MSFAFSAPFALTPNATRSLFSPSPLSSSSPLTYTNLPQPISKRHNAPILSTAELSPPHQSSTSSVSPPPQQQPSYSVHQWTFKSFNVQYATSGVSQSPQYTSKPAVIFVHGFGANCEHWRNNLASIASLGFRVYALDLLGFGMGDKPAPGTLDSDGDKVEYTFDYWTTQLTEFLDTVVDSAQSNRTTKNNPPVFLIANSIGCMVTMQFSIQHPTRVAALTFISPSLRQLNVRKRSKLQNITAPLLMRILSYRPLGAFFLDSLSKPKALRSVLNAAYAVSSAVDDDLIRILREPAMTQGALDVFLSFITYDEGPVPEDFLPDLTQPALVIWGENDQFEPFELGQKLRHYSIVESFVPLPGTGHCAHDERPEQCNQLIGDFLEKHRNRTQLTT